MKKRSLGQTIIKIIYGLSGFIQAILITIDFYIFPLPFYVLLAPIAIFLGINIFGFIRIIYLGMKIQKKNEADGRLSS
jgi:hypothetical protein